MTLVKLAKLAWLIIESTRHGQGIQSTRSFGELISLKESNTTLLLLDFVHISNNVQGKYMADAQQR